jgi:putative ABC transport system ATP-binding protein
MIELLNVHMAYRTRAVGVTALKGISLSVREGLWLSVVGPSGSGKSTMLNIIGLLDRPTSGDYLFRGQDVSALSDCARAQLRNHYFGFIFQSFNLIPQLSAVQNVAVPLYYAGVERRRRGRIARELLDQVGLADRYAHRPAELSGGEEQRVTIARALANSPTLILADEPTGSLDQTSGREVLDLMAGLHLRGMGVILVTHDQAVSALAQETIRLVDGRIVSRTAV